MNGHIAKELLHYLMTTFDFSLFILVNILLIVSNNSFWKCLSNGINLRDISSTSDSNSNIKILESLESEKKDRLKDLNSEWLRLQKLNRWTVDSQNSFSRSDSGNSYWVFLSAEALNELGFVLWHMAIISFINNEY